MAEEAWSARASWRRREGFACARRVANHRCAALAGAPRQPKRRPPTRRVSLARLNGHSNEEAAGCRRMTAVHLLHSISQIRVSRQPAAGMPALPASNHNSCRQRTRLARTQPVAPHRPRKRLFSRRRSASPADFSLSAHYSAFSDAIGRSRTSPNHSHSILSIHRDALVYQRNFFLTTAET